MSPPAQSELPGGPNLPEETSNDSDILERPPLPPFTLVNVLTDIKNGVSALVLDPFAVRFVGPAVVFTTSILSKIVIHRIPYTEIDFSTYMQQIAMINDGELDYANIRGDSGPIVYPAGFVQIYQFLYLMTGGGENLHEAQIVFGYLFTLTNLLVVTAYCVGDYVPPWSLILLLASKRLMSIYVLRLFNDCFTTLCMVAVTVILQQASYWAESAPVISYVLALIATDLFSLAVTIKMNALLYLPGFLIIAYFLCRENLFKFFGLLLVFPFVQITTGWSFLLPMFSDEEARTIRLNYLTHAFDFSRKFLYKWTVNWRFINEETFLLDAFAHALLVGHFSVIALFVGARFLLPLLTGKPLSKLIKDFFSYKSTIAPENVFLNRESGPRFVLLVLSVSNLIGVLFSRSLHYQFLSWYCWQLPYLLYITGWPIYVCITLWTVHEYCWNVFPSTPVSSAVLVLLLTIVLARIFQRERLWENNIEEKRSKIDKKAE